MSKEIVETNSMSETLGNHLRNLLSPYQCIVDVLEYCKNNDPKSYMSRKLIEVQLNNIENFKKNLEELIEFSKSENMESNYWRI